MRDRITHADSLGGMHGEIANFLSIFEFAMHRLPLPHRPVARGAASDRNSRGLLGTQRRKHERLF
jgi:hypothetical protein